MRFLLAFAALLMSLPALAQPIAGPARAIDGDTLEIDGTRVRLWGVDAPEYGQRCHNAEGALYTCGRLAKAALEKKIEGRVLSCSSREIDDYDRVVAVCRIGRTDLGGWMVSQGHAVAYRENVYYARRQDKARAASLGIWAGTFIEPYRWRRGAR